VFEVSVVTGDAEWRLAWVVCDLNQFVLSLTKFDQLALHFVTKDNCVFTKVHGRGENRGSNLDSGDGISAAPSVDSRRIVESSMSLPMHAIRSGKERSAPHLPYHSAKA
jgi:hypothetical protein